MKKDHPFGKGMKNAEIKLTGRLDSQKPGACNAKRRRAYHRNGICGSRIHIPFADDNF